MSGGYHWETLSFRKENREVNVSEAEGRSGGGLEGVKGQEIVMGCII